MAIRMVHHDGRNYQDAVSEAAKHARGKMELMLERGAQRTKEAMERVEASVPTDFMDKGKDLELELKRHEVEGKTIFNLLMQGKYVPGGTTIHRHALGQIRERSGAPDMKYIDRMLAGNEDQQDRVVDLLNEHLHKDVGDDRNLVRTVNSQALGFLSDQYKRFDSPSLFNLFLDVAQKNGAVLVGGDSTSIRHTMRAFIPHVFEPVKDEVLCIGVEMLNGDFGGSRFVVRMIINRLWCTNLATMMHGIKKTHIGARLPEDVVFSDKTMKLDTELLVSASNDVIKSMLQPERVDAVLQAIKTASEAELEWRDAEKLLAKHLRKPELEMAQQMFETKQDDPTGPVPPAKSFYKAAQILSWQANQVEGERRLDLMQASGQLMDRFLPKAA